MKIQSIFPAWARILQGYRPFLALEITKECPLRCPGCYAYQENHLNSEVALRQLTDLRGKELVDAVLRTVEEYRPLHVSIIGGEPMMRWRELDELLPVLNRMNVEVQLVTSAVIPIPATWSKLPNLHLAVSVDGLPPEHDKRRAPATYARILENIAGHEIITHCTVTRDIPVRDLEEFARFWSERSEVHRVWFSLYTPQQGENGEQRLSPHERFDVLKELARIRKLFPKIYLPNRVFNAMLHPPQRPEECVFARTTSCLSADFRTPITPCQIGGSPVCSECGCLATAGMTAIGRYKLGGLVRVGDIFRLSERIGRRMARDQGGASRDAATEMD